MEEVEATPNPWWRCGLQSVRKPVICAVVLSMFLHFYGWMYLYRCSNTAPPLADTQPLIVAFCMGIFCDISLGYLLLFYCQMGNTVDDFSKCIVFWDVTWILIHMFIIVNWMFGIFGDFDTAKNLKIAKTVLIAEAISIADHLLLYGIGRLYRREPYDYESERQSVPVVTRPPSPVVRVVRQPITVTNISNTYHVNRMNVNNGSIRPLNDRGNEERRQRRIAYDNVITVDE